MQITITDESHADHLSADNLSLVLSLVSDETQQVNFGTFAIHVVTLPEGMTVQCALRGPETGEAPVLESDVFYGTRNGRPNISRLTRLPATVDSRVTVLLGRETTDDNWSLITAYGGPLAPQEPGDPYLPAEKHSDSVKFWSEHALSVDGSPESSVSEETTFESFSKAAVREES